MWLKVLFAAAFFAFASGERLTIITRELNAYTELGPKPAPTKPIVLPRDDSFLITPVQWWYWTGHLSSGTSKTFGFEFCFFIVEGVVNLVQVALTDVVEQKFVYTEDLGVELDILRMNSTTGTFNLSSRKGVQVAKGGDGSDELSFSVGDFTVNLSLQSTKPAAQHYSGHAHPYSFGGWTYYYSRTHMQAQGSLSNSRTGEELAVSGTGWFDRQWGDLAQAVLQGWQWFAIELDDNTQIMLFDFNGDSSESYGSVTFANGTTADIHQGSEFTVTILANWTSPASGCTYPSLWAVELNTPLLPQQTLSIVPKVADQELKVMDSPTYWEGASYVTVGATSVGNAYVELNGYCPKGF